MERGYQENSKRLLCVTGTEQMSRHLLSHTRSVFGDRLGVACFTRNVDEPSLFKEYCARKPGIIIGL